MTTGWTRRIGWITVAVVAVDWLSKFWILNRLALYERIAVLGSWMHLVRTENRGIAFGMLNSNSAAWQTPALLIAGGIVVYWLVRLERSIGDHVARIGIALIAGGAVGNLGDRLVNGGVTDFILFDAFPFIFNIADAALVVGSLLLVSRLMTAERDDASSIAA